MTKRAEKAQRDRRAAAHAFDREVGERIRFFRQADEQSQGALAALVGISVAQVSRYESGETTCEPHMLALIAEALGCKPSAFMDGIKVGDGK